MHISDQFYLLVQLCCPLIMAIIKKFVMKVSTINGIISICVESYLDDDETSVGVFLPGLGAPVSEYYFCNDSLFINSIMVFSKYVDVHY